MAVYRNLVTVEVLSSHLWTVADLRALPVLHAAITDGMSSGLVQVSVYNDPLEDEEAREALARHDTDPAFFGLPPAPETPE